MLKLHLLRVLLFVLFQTHIHGSPAGKSAYENYNSYGEDIDLELNLGIGNIYTSSNEASDESSTNMSLGRSSSYNRQNHGARHECNHQGRLTSVQIPYEAPPIQYNSNGVPDAGWYTDKNTPKRDKNKVADYLQIEWRYVNDDRGRANTRKRMKGKIGYDETAILTQWERYPEQAKAIAKETMPYKNNPDNAVTTEKGDEVFRALVSEYRMGPSMAAEEVKEAFMREEIWSMSPDKIIKHIKRKYQM